MPKMRKYGILEDNKWFQLFSVLQALENIIGNIQMDNRFWYRLSHFEKHIKKTFFNCLQFPKGHLSSLANLQYITKFQVSSFEFRVSSINRDLNIPL